MQLGNGSIVSNPGMMRALFSRLAPVSSNKNPEVTQMKVVINENLSIEVIDLKKEYTGALPYTDNIKYAIVSDDKNEEELASIKELKAYIPFVVITSKMYEVMRDSNNNNAREHMRESLHHDVYAIEEDRVPIDPLSDPAAISESNDTYKHIIEEMLKLPGRQGRRMYQHYVLGLTVEEIAKAEGVAAVSVYQSIQRAKKALHKVFVESGVTAE